MAKPFRTRSDHSSPARFSGFRGRIRCERNRTRFKHRNVNCPRAFCVHASFQSGSDTEKTSDLQSLLQWLVANGSKGIGEEGSKIGVFEAEDDSHGILLLEDVEEGDLLATVPLRLALTDHPDDSESNEALGKDSPSDVRLARKLLQQKRLGKDSPWWPFLQILPARVTSPYGDWSDSATMNLQFPAAIKMFQKVCNRVETQRIEDYSQEDVKWALSIVHSRSFMSAGKEGTEGVRMLLPLADLFNHTGRESAFLLSGSSSPDHNVEWNIVPPSESSGWTFQFKAARDEEEVPPGIEATISYGDHSSQSFLLHYGFVPPRNTFDTVVLFKNTEEAIDWFLDRFPPEGNSESSKTQALRLNKTRSKELPKNLKDDFVAQAQNDNLIITAQGGVDARLLENFASLIVNEDKDFMANDPFLSGRAALGDQGDSVKDYSDILGVLRVDEEEIMNGKEAISSPQNMSVLVRSKAKRLVALRIMELLNGPNVTGLLTDLGLLAVAKFLDDDSQSLYKGYVQYYAKVLKEFDSKYGHFMLLAGLTAKSQEEVREDVKDGVLDFDEASVQSLLWRTSQKQVLWNCLVSLME